MKDKLLKVRALIERGWSQGSYARDGNGRSVDLGSWLAASFCLSGAIKHACWNDYDAECQIDVLLDMPQGIVCWNDAHIRTKQEVLDRIDAAIARAG